MHLIAPSTHQYQQQLECKVAHLKSLLSPFTTPPLNIYSSPIAGFRFRAEFGIWHEGEALDYTMRNPQNGELILIQEYPIGSSLIQALMPVLKEQLSRIEILRRKLFQVEFLTSRLGESLITLIYHKPLDDQWQQQAEKLANSLRTTCHSLHVIGRSKKQKICIDQDYVRESFDVQSKSFIYQQVENSFTQPNAFMNEQMLSWAAQATQNIGGDLLELYCGNGNFTLPLSFNFNQVLTTEVSKSSIKSLEYNLEKNNIKNIKWARLSSEEASQAINKVRPFKRLSHINLDDYQFSTVFIDPPRAGLDEQTIQLVKKFNHICYISCNPNSLIDNLKKLDETHHIKNAALFDQFPYTEHTECGLFLSKK